VPFARVPAAACRDRRCSRADPAADAYGDRVLTRLALSRSTLDRAAHRRGADLLPKLLADPQTQVVVLRGDQAAVVDDGSGEVRLAMLTPVQAARLSAAVLTAGSAPSCEVDLYLGEDGRRQVVARALSPAPSPGADGAPGADSADYADGDHLLDALAAVVPGTAGARWAGLREVGTLLDDAGAGILTAALALALWHRVHPRCARCGEPTDVIQAGWARRCPACGAEHYPRTDPAVIMSVVDGAERILLGRQAVWPERRYSTLAGFVEPGESLEAAVRREVFEESAVVVGEVTYLGSQPWPFPSSLMLGFRATALSTEITVDGAELAHARWWTRAELAADVESGALLLPPGVSIARRLIEEWFGSRLEADDAWR
jgi:NAD+ diphosphatase